MDSKDRQIIRSLQRNGRATNLEIAAEINLSPSPCLRRIRLLEESGAIQGYRAIADQRAYGLPVTVFIRIRLERHTGETSSAFRDSRQGTRRGTGMPLDDRTGRLSVAGRRRRA